MEKKKDGIYFVQNIKNAEKMEREDNAIKCQPYLSSSSSYHMKVKYTVIKGTID